MTSVFGIPLENLGNVSDDSAHYQGGIYEEKSIFVGGRYQEKHANIFQLFHFNMTEESREIQMKHAMVHLFTLAPVFVILLCQVGFACVLSGASRAENAATPFLVSLINFGFMFWGVGYPIARTSGIEFLGYRHWFSIDIPESLSTDWLVYFSLVLTAVNIASFGPMERSPLWIYILLSAAISGLACPAAIRWGWHSTGWLNTLTLGHGVRYKDFGGAGAVHAVGGGAALACTLLMGTRHGRCRLRKSKVLMNDREGHSVPMEILGGGLILVCFACTNTIRVLTTCVLCDALTEFSRALQNSIIAACMAFIVTMATVTGLRAWLGEWRLMWLLSRLILNSLTIGMVSVSAGSDVLKPWAACVMGGTASFGYILWCVLLYVIHIDDPVGIIAVHLGGSIWSIVGVTVFREDVGAVFHQETAVFMCMLWNVIGVLVIGGCSFAVVMAVIIVPRLFKCVPLSHSKELQGLDEVLFRQRAYQMGGHTVATHFSMNTIEDREMYSYVDSPTTQQLLTSPPSYNFHGLTPAPPKQDIYLTHYLGEHLQTPVREHVSQGTPANPMTPKTPVTPLTQGLPTPSLYRTA